MAAVLLFWDTNMAAVTSCENTLFIILAPSRRVDSIKISLSRDLRARTRLFLRAHFQILRHNELPYGSMAETSEFYLQLSAFNLPPSLFQ